MNLRSVLGSLQLPIASFGLLVAVGSVQQFLALSASPTEGDGFVTGLAALVLYGLALVGVVVTALGFAIPPGDGVGIQFNRWQRRLFIGAAAAAILSVFVPLVAWSVVATTGLGFEVVSWTWVALLGGAVVTLVGSLTWRLGETVAVRL